jgi:hypothetical protein
VRKTLGLSFEGERYEGEQFIQADCKIRWSLPKGSSYLFLTGHAEMMVIEMPGDAVRVFISLPDDVAKGVRSVATALFVRTSGSLAHQESRAEDPSEGSRPPARRGPFRWARRLRHPGREAPRGAATRSPMKILAIIDVAPGADVAALRSDLPAELRGSWGLFSSGVLREAYATAAPTRVIFVLEATSTEEASAQLRTLPLVASGAMRFELVELRPFVNWSMLFAK